MDRQVLGPNTQPRGALGLQSPSWLRERTLTVPSTKETQWVGCMGSPDPPYYGSQVTTGKSVQLTRCTPSTEQWYMSDILQSGKKE